MREGEEERGLSEGSKETWVLLTPPGTPHTPSHDSRAMTRSAWPHAWSQASLAQHERLPELPIISREKPHTGAAARENP